MIPQPPTAVAMPPPFFPSSPRPFLSAVASLPGDTDMASMTRVSLAHIDRRIRLYLRFGEPSRIVPLDRWLRVALFVPGAVFCRIRWQAKSSGKVHWELMVMQACTSRVEGQRIAGVQPGAELLLHVHGEPSVRAVLAQVDVVETQGIAPATVSPMYWCTLGSRLAARQPLPAYTAARHAAWLAGRPLV